MIEKHFTLDYALKLPDYQASLDPGRFRKLVESVRMVPLAIGDGRKRVLETEVKWREAGRKSIFTARRLAEGEVISAQDLIIRRPADGLHPHLLDHVVGRRARCEIPENTLLSWDMV